MQLKNKIAIVTGASRGMGALIAKVLAGEGASVALVGRDQDRLDETAQAITDAGGRASIHTTDIRSWDEVEQMVSQVVDQYGDVDILVNSAFWGPPGSIEETDEDFWDKTLDTCLKGPFLCSRAVAPYMKKKNSGRIINIGSLAGKIGEDNRTAYCAAKWGLEGLSAALSVELGKFNIHVHLVSPAATNTPWWREVGAVLSPETLERMIPVEVIGSAVLWLLSQPDQVHIPDVPVYNFRNPFEGKGSPFET
jgi:3-oxoacyl-[acyl-carrier protein] reductase